MNKIETLKKTFLFDHLLNKEIQAISTRFSIKPFNQGDLILKQGEINDQLYIIKSGHVKVSTSDSEGADRPLSFLGLGDSFGEMSLITGETVSANVSAVIDTETLTIKKDDFEKLLQSCPSVSTKISHLLSKRLKETNLSLDLKQLETGFTTLIFPDESPAPLLDASVLIGATLAKQFKKKVMLVILIPEVSQNRIESLVKCSLNQESEDDVLKTYTSIEGLCIGFLKQGAENHFSEQGSKLLSDFFSRYNHILAVTKSNRKLNECTFFRQANKTIAFYPGEIFSGNVAFPSIPQLQNTEIALGVFNNNLNIEKVGKRIREHFKGPVFIYSSASQSQDSSSGILKTARFILNKTLGIVFGGGGARGFAHIGVMRALEKHHLEPDAYCGSSMGGIVASFYAMGLKTDEVINIIRRYAIKKGNKFDFQIPIQSLIKGKKLEKMAKEVYGSKNIEELLNKLYLVCADLISGEEVVLESGLLRKGVYASCSLPGVMPPVRMGKYYLIDGSLLNKVPASVLKERGIQHVISINVTPRRDQSFFKEDAIENAGGFKKFLMKSQGFKKLFTEPHILKIITRSFELINYKLSYAEIGSEDILIAPTLGNFEFFGFDNIEKIIDEGEIQAEESIKKIKRLIYSS